MATNDRSCATRVGQSETSNPSRIRNLTGQRFAHWTVVSLSTRRGVDRGAIWVCACDCGTIKEVSAKTLRDGTSRCCGCLNAATTHGMSRTPEYVVWCKMKERCYNARSRCYQNYGGRGISVCDRWRLSFQAFLEDMGNRPGTEYELDRYPDNNGNYRPGNCRWAKRIQNSRNKRTNRRLAFDGKCLCVTEWAESLGMSHRTISYRIKLGWTIEKALTTPIQPASERWRNFTVSTKA